MKVLAINSNYTQNQKCKKEVNFEAVNVNVRAIEGFKTIAGYKTFSLTERLMHYPLTENPTCKLGKKLEAVIRTITGIDSNTPLESVYDRAGNGVSLRTTALTDSMKDMFLSEKEFKALKPLNDDAFQEAINAWYAENRKLGEQTKAGIIERLTMQEGKAPEQEKVNTLMDEAWKQGEDQRTQTKIAVFDRLWDQEGTKCNQLKKMVEGFVADADKEGRQVTKEDVSGYLAKLRAHETAKKLADDVTCNEARAKWGL